MKYFSKFSHAIIVLMILSAGWFGCSDNPVSSGKIPASEIGDSHVYIGPIQESSPATFDFGYVPQYSEISHVYWLHNRSFEPVEIISVRPG